MVEFYVCIDKSTGNCLQPGCQTNIKENIRTVLDIIQHPADSLIPSLTTSQVITNQRS